MNADSLTIGRTYRAKKPAPTEGLVNDRTVVWISPTRSQVQYDGPAIKIGMRRPVVDTAAFLKWADRDVTDELPRGEYAEWK